MSEETNRKNEPITETTAGAINEAVNIAADEAASESKPVTKGNEPEKDGLLSNRININYHQRRKKHEVWVLRL